MTNIWLNKLTTKLLIAIILAVTVLGFGLNQTYAAGLSVSPSSGEFAVGATFDVSVNLDTKGQTVNAIALEMSFPPDKLQVISPAVGNSIIGIYTTAPKYDNNAGRIEIVGGIHNGINVSSGLVAKISFKVIAPGSANLRILSSSQTLLNDGQGTDVLNDINGGIYTLELNSENGPEILLDSSQIKNEWFYDDVITINWQQSLNAEGYSYILSHNPNDIPDDIIDSKNGLVVYKNLASGVYYFHIKELVGNNWGPTRHQVIKVDNTAPEEFDIEVWPGVVTTDRHPRFKFETTDANSGIDRYEIMIVDVKRANSYDQSFFVPTQTEYSPANLDYGSYDVIVRAYDKAGNARESVKRVVISDSPLRMLGDRGLFLYGNTVLPWYLVFISSLLVLVGLLILTYIVRKRYKRLLSLTHPELMPEQLKTQLSELEKYREKYGKLTSVLLALIISFGILITSSVSAQISDNASPVISSYPSVIQEDEIFYISGRTSEPESEVIVHLQGLSSQQVEQYSVKADKLGDWFYQHEGFLPAGQYAVWTIAKNGNQVSPPGGQVHLEVRSIAFQFAGAKITHQTLYTTALLVMAILIVLLVGILALYLWRHRRRHLHLLDELKKAEHAIAYGFIQLKHDLAAELALLQSQNNNQLTGELGVRAEQIREDINDIENLVGEEITEVKRSS